MNLKSYAIISVFVLNILFWPFYASAQTVPRYFNYQAVLFDEGGNPLPDGETRLFIRIFDSEMAAVYEEEQTVEVVSGIVSVTVGLGADPETAVLTGGISPDAIRPDGIRYLEVQAEGYPAEDLMEIVSVPYSTYADMALNVADNSIGGNQIKESSILMSHLTAELVDDLTNQIVGTVGESRVILREEFTEYVESISGTEGAKNIGVTSDFAYSSANNLQDVLYDFDLSIKKRAEDAKKVDESNLSLDGSQAMAGTLDMGLNNITGLRRPETDRDATPKDYVDMKSAYVLDELRDHEEDVTNPHGVTTTQIGAATQSAFSAHTNTTTSPNPHGITTSKIGAATQSAFSSHLDTINNPNPHSITPTLIGAATPTDISNAIAAIDLPDFGVGDIPNDSINLNKMGAVVISGSANIDRNGNVGITSGPCRYTAGSNGPAIKCTLDGGGYSSLDTGYSPHYITIFRVVVGSLGYYKPTFNLGNPRVNYYFDGGGGASWEKYIEFDFDGNGGSNGATVYWKTYRINE